MTAGVDVDVGAGARSCLLPIVCISTKVKGAIRHPGTRLSGWLVGSLYSHCRTMAPARGNGRWKAWGAGELGSKRRPKTRIGTPGNMVRSDDWVNPARPCLNARSLLSIGHQIRGSQFEHCRCNDLGIMRLTSSMTVQSTYLPAYLGALVDFIYDLAPNITC